MKKLFLFCALCIMLVNAWAVPARRDTMIYTQPDGTEIIVYQHGDEYFHWITNEKGEWIERNEVGDFVVVPALTKDEIAARRAAAPRNKIAQKRQASALNIAPRGLIILVNFTDVAFETDKAEIDSMITAQSYTRDYSYTYNQNQYHITSNGSARQYFYDASYGQYNPQFDVVGPVTISQNVAYYGENDSYGMDKKPEAMICEACELVDDSVDFSLYDNDKDGVVDFVYVYYAGYGEADGGGEYTIWPHQYLVSNSQNLQLDGKQIDKYACSNELDFYSKQHTGIGTFCHEFSHVLGLPDLYVTNEASHRTCADWDILDYGSYNNDGNTPPTYSAYERFFMGWLVPRLITEPENVMLKDLGTNNEALLISPTDQHNLIGNDPNPTTFYLLENRQQSGWDKYLHGHGMMLTKIQYSSSKWYNNTVNNTATAMGVDLIEADGIAPELGNSGYYDGKTSDLFPAGNTEYIGIENHPINNIQEKNGVITFNYKNVGTSTSGNITYELNGGITNDYGWMSKNDMFQACMADCGVTGLATLDELKAAGDVSYTTICNKLTDVTGMLSAEKWDWLEAYIMEVQNADAAATALVEGTTSAGWRYAVASFFLESKRASWPVSADFSQAGKDEAYIPAWKHAYANPTEPTGEWILNAPYKEGETFFGWYWNADFSGQEVTVINAESNGTLYAKWIKYVPTIAEVKTLADNTETQVSGVVTFINGKNVYVQDATGGMLLYMKESPTFAVSQKVVVRGTKVIYGGAPEVKNCVEIDCSNATMPTPIVFENLDNLVNDTDLKYFSQLVKVPGLTISGYDGYYNPTVSDNLGNQAVCYKMTLDPVEFPIGTKLTLTAIAGYYDGFRFVGDIAGVEKAIAGVKENYTYPVRDNKYHLENNWVISVKEENYAANKPGSTGYVRGMATKDGIMYFINRETESIVRVDGATGKMLEPIKITGEHLFEVEQEDGTFTSAVTLPFNDIHFDQAGNLLIGGVMEKVQQHFMIYIVDIETGVATLLIDECLADNPDYAEIVCRFDAFGVAGNVTKNGVIMAAAANSWNVYRWLITDGVAAPAEQITMMLDPDFDNYLASNATSFGIAPQVSPQDEAGTIFYVDGSNTLPMLFDENGNLIDDFVNNEVYHTTITNNEGETLTMNSGYNGLVEFQVGEEYFLLMAASNTIASVPSAFALYKFKDESRMFSEMEPLWYFPHNGLGSATNGCSTAVPSVEVNRNTATISIYAVNNGYASYTFTMEDTSTLPETPLLDTIYFVNVNDWTGTITAHAWGGTAAGTTWPGLPTVKETEQIGGKDVYSFSAEAGAYAYVIFTNQTNGSAQTKDLNWTSGKYYVIDDWYTKEEAEKKLTSLTQKSYTVAGAPEIVFGTDWDPTNTDNDMVKQADSTYKWEKTELELTATTVEFKICEDHTWDVSYPTTAGSNYKLTIAESGIYTITIMFNPTTEVINATATKTGLTTPEIDEPVTMVGLVKRALQMGESTVILTHEADGTPHIYNVVDGLAYEVSQKGVIARDPENAGDYLAISDIAATEDGKLTACNYIRCQYGDNQVDAGYKRGTKYFYIWDTLESDARVWFTAQDGANSYRSDGGYTLAVKGESKDCQVLVSQRHYTATSGGGALRMSCYSVTDGVPSYTYYGHSISADENPPLDASRDGENIQFILSPRGEKKEFIFDADKVTPMEFSLPDSPDKDVTILGIIPTNLLNVNFNGVSCVAMGEQALMVAPYANAEGKLAGVKILDITDGLATATEVAVANLDTPVEATAAATAVQVVENGLNINLVADATIYPLTTVAEGPEYTVIEDEITNLVIDLESMAIIGGPGTTWQVEVFLGLGQEDGNGRFALTEESSVAIMGFDARFIDGYAYDIDVNAPAAKVVLHVEESGFFYEIRLDMTSAAPEVSITEESATICHGETYTWNGQTYSTEGEYSVTLSNSIATLHLSIMPKAKEDVQYKTINKKETPFVWDRNGKKYFETITDSVFVQYTHHNCDSIIYILDLTVVDIEDVKSEYDTICESALPYEWNGLNITTGGRYEHTEKYEDTDIDVLTVLYLTITPTIRTQQSATICYGETFDWNGSTFNQTGDYTYTTEATNGCDSIITLHLTVLPQAITISTDTMIAHADLPYQWRGQDCHVSGEYTDAIPFAANSACDSVIFVLNLVVEATNKCGTDLSWEYDNGLLTITGSGAMYDSPNLLSYRNESWYPYRIRQVALPDGITHLGNVAFADCANLTNIAIPSSVTSIGDGVFSWTGLQSITIPANVTDLGEQIFESCSALSTLLYEGTPSSINNQTIHPFIGCVHLDTVIAPAALWHCTSADPALEARYGVPHKARYIEVTDGELTDKAMEYIANNRGSLEVLDLTAATNTTLPLGALMNATTLSTLYLPQTIHTIPEMFAEGCHNLSEIIIPATATEIGNHAFAGCTNVWQITSEAVLPPTIYPETFKDIDRSISVIVPAGSEDAYRQAPYWQEFFIEQTTDNAPALVNKVLRNDRIYILRNGKIYSIMGQQVQTTYIE